MTQLEYARRGLITEQMQLAALAEGVSSEFIRDGLAAGNIVICHNIKHANGMPLPVGAGRFSLDALAAAAQHARFTGVDQPRETALEFLVHHITHPITSAKSASAQVG